MNRYDCGAIRDLLAPLVRGEMLPHEAASAQLHLDACAECRAEGEIVRLLQESFVPVPDGLDARVLAAVGRRSLMRGRPARLALAATLAAAVIGGPLMFEGSRGNSVSDLDAVSWAAARDPMLHGHSELPELSVEELEVLLEEFDR